MFVTKLSFSGRTSSPANNSNGMNNGKTKQSGLKQTRHICYSYMAPFVFMNVNDIQSLFRQYFYSKKCSAITGDTFYNKTTEKISYLFIWFLKKTFPCSVRPQARSSSSLFLLFLFSVSFASLESNFQAYWTLKTGTSASVRLKSHCLIFVGWI